MSRPSTVNLQIEDPHLETVWSAAQEAGAIQQRRLGSSTSTEKSGVADVVTATDSETEQVIEETLTGAYPDYQILSEEGNPETALREGEYTWIIDPIDGTLNYAHGVPLYCVSIGLYEGTSPVVGGVYAPALDRFYYGRAGDGAYRNETRIRVSETATLEEAYLSMDITRINDSPETLLGLFAELTTHGQGAIQIMAAALSLCFVAEGAVDGACHRGLSLWDFAAAKLIIDEAGGTISSFDGATGWDAVNAGHIVGTNGEIHESLLDRYATLS